MLPGAIARALAGQGGFRLLAQGAVCSPAAIAFAGPARSAARLAAGVQAIHVAQGLGALRSTALLLPLAYSFACVNQLLWAVLLERELHLPGPLTDMGTCLDNIRSGQVEMLCLVAQQTATLLRCAPPLVQVRCVNFAGSPFPMRHFEELRALFPHARLINNYGCAEAMPRLCCTEVTQATASTAFVGQPVGAIELRIDQGAIEFRGPSAALGTIGSDGALRPFGDWIASGDLGSLDADGLYIMGRHDQVIKIGGERLTLLDVEQAFTAFGAHQVLVWVEDGERIHAVIGMTAAPALRDLLQFLRQRLPRALLPAAIFYARDWPLNANQKTDRPALQTRAGRGQLDAIWPAP